MKPFIALAFILTLSFSFGQEGKKREQIKQQKIAFITQEVGFTEKEAEKFWPKYNEMQEEAKELRKAAKETKKALREIDTKSDKEIQKLLNDVIENEKAVLNKRQEFKDDLLDILPPKKVAKYFIAEQKFKKVLLEKLKQKREGRQGEPQK